METNWGVKFEGNVVVIEVEEMEIDFQYELDIWSVGLRQLGTNMT